MSRAIIDGVVCWVCDYDFIVSDNGCLMHCRSSHPPKINASVSADGTIRSSVKSFNGQSVVVNYYDFDA